MGNVELGKVIAERVLQSLKLTNHVTVRIGRPQKTESGDFITPYQIVGVDNDKVRFAAGVDAVQSLQLVLQMIGAEIHCGLKEYQLRWADGDDPGLPAP
jgi:hypothetical protein